MRENLIHTIGHLVWPLELYGHGKTQCYYCNRLLDLGEAKLWRSKYWHRLCLEQIRAKGYLVPVTQKEDKTSVARN